MGAKTVGLTRFFIAVFFILTFPMSKALDWVLGQEVGNVYSRSELLK